MLKKMWRRQKTISFSWCLAALFVSSCNNKDELPQKVTFTEHVAPILYKNCVICHRPGGTSHFSLSTYADVKPYATSIAYVCREKMMPPWPADPNYMHFAGERLLSD